METIYINTTDTNSYSVETVVNVTVNTDSIDTSRGSNPYAGSGTSTDPYIVTWLDNDVENPHNWSKRRRRFITIITSISLFMVSLDSSTYAAAAPQLMAEFHVTSELITLGLSLYVLGFAFGPLLWGPLSEMYGRRPVFTSTYLVFIVFMFAASGSPNIASLLVFRFIAGMFGASTLTNSAATISDIWIPIQRGAGMALYAVCAFCGPIVGPIIGGYVSETSGWFIDFIVMSAAPTGAYIVYLLVVPETYHPVILRRRAIALESSDSNGCIYRSSHDTHHANIGLKEKLKMSLVRPWGLLLLEPILLLITIWIAIVYGTLYLFFEAFPIVFAEGRGWTQGETGLAFLGIGFGVAVGVALNYFVFDPQYIRTSKQYESGGKQTPPEARLPMACIGAILCPAGLFAFAWTTYPSIHWAVCICVASPFGTGMVLIFLSAQQYIIDVYQLYAASAMAGNSLLRSLFGFAFPLFASQMFHGLGVQWASTLLAFLSLMCTPIPFAFSRYGYAIRQMSLYAKSDKQIQFQKHHHHWNQNQNQEDQCEKNILSETATSDAAIQLQSPPPGEEKPRDIEISVIDKSSIQQRI